MRWWLSASVILGAIACGDAIVGGECRPGALLCDGRCVDPQTDYLHCGRCGNDCGVFECAEAMCTDRVRAGLDGGLPDGGGVSGDGSAGRNDAGLGAGAVGSPFLSDGGFDFPDTQVGLGCSVGQQACGGECANLATSREHCGACGVQCSSDEYCVDGECLDRCESPLQLCGGSCVRFDSDPRHCGRCGNVCRSGLCVGGVCADAVAGHVVAVGHDYTAGSSETMRRMVANAIFLARGAPVRVLEYRGEAQDGSISGVRRAIDAIEMIDGRTWQSRVAEVDDVPLELAESDAFLVHAQRGATDDELLELGQRWGLALSQFLLRGGVIVVLETDAPENDGTFQVLAPAGLFDAAAREPAADGRLMVVEPGVGVAARATREYPSVPGTVHFLDVMTPGEPIVRDSEGEPVVVYRVVAP